MIDRKIYADLKNDLFKGKAILIFGSRQVGKTTLVETLLEDHADMLLLMSGDEPDQRAKLSNITSSELKLMLGKNKILFIDEAQRIENVGLTIKPTTDHIKDVQVVTTSKSSYNPMREAVNLFSKV